MENTLKVEIFAGFYFRKKQGQKLGFAVIDIREWAVFPLFSSFSCSIWRIFDENSRVSEKTTTSRELILANDQKTHKTNGQYLYL